MNTKVLMVFFIFFVVSTIGALVAVCCKFHPDFFGFIISVFPMMALGALVIYLEEKRK